jgi:hypothetical protein
MMVENLVNTRYCILVLVAKMLIKTTLPSAKQLQEQLWLSPALVDASLAQLAAWCQYNYFQHIKKQQQEHRKEPGEVCKQNQKQKKGGTSSSLKSSTRRPELGSSSSSSSKVAAFKLASASSWSELKVLPDHEQVAVAGGQAAVAAHLWRLAQVHDRLNPDELQSEGVCAAILLASSLLPEIGILEGDKELPPGDVRLSRRPAATIAALQLALQGIACKGIELEAAVAGSSDYAAGASCCSRLWGMVQLLLKQVRAADRATRRAFVAARGGYMLQVMWLVMKMAVEEQQKRGQQQQPHQQEPGTDLVTDLVPEIMCLMFRAQDGEKFLLDKGKV